MGSTGPVSPSGSASSLADVLLASLNPAAVAAGHDVADAVTHRRHDAEPQRPGRCRDVGGRTRRRRRAGRGAGDTDRDDGAGRHRLPDRRRAVRPGARRRRRRPSAATSSPTRGRRRGSASCPMTRTGRRYCRTFRYGCTRGRGTATASRLREAPAMVMYTSGTTGPPKGVLLSRQAIAADIDALAHAWQWTPDDTLVHGLPLFHVHGLVLGLLGSLRVGSRFVHTGRPTPAAYARGRRVALLRRADGVVARSWPTWTSAVALSRRGCWSRAVRRCRCRCSTSWRGSPGTRRSSATAAPSR